jgi:histidine triad (HIT) family protein
MDCIFCKIGAREIQSDFLYEDDNVFVIRDLHPKAKVHVLVIPKQHVVTFNDLPQANPAIMQHCIKAIDKVTRDLGINESGYKVVTNNGKDGGQAVLHLHMHILGGESIKGIT